MVEKTTHPLQPKYLPEVLKLRRAHMGFSSVTNWSPHQVLRPPLTIRVTCHLRLNIKQLTGGRNMGEIRMACKFELFRFPVDLKTIRASGREGYMANRYVYALLHLVNGRSTQAV